MHKPLLTSLLLGTGLALYARLHSVPHQQPLADSQAYLPRKALGTLEVLSLNLGHGRGQAASQWRIGSAEHRANLERVATLARREATHVVALQEVDGPSWWSGGFDHLVLLQGCLNQPASAHGLHGGAAGLTYGTALLGSDHLNNGLSHSFGALGPTPRKGFTIAQTTLDGRELDVISLHLDFALPALRRRQLAEVVEVVNQRGRPTVWIGDFNMEPEALAPFVMQHGLSTLPNDVSFRRTGGRIDHVLVSSDLELVELWVLPDFVSDHQGVRASIRWASAVDQGAGRVE